MTSTLRNRILRLVAARKLSYTLIAARCNVSRGAVAGIVFRERHPVAVRIASPGRKSRNKTGTGWVPPAYDPERSKREWTEQHRRAFDLTCRSRAAQQQTRRVALQGRDARQRDQPLIPQFLHAHELLLDELALGLG